MSTRDPAPLRSQLDALFQEARQAITEGRQRAACSALDRLEILESSITLAEWDAMAKLERKEVCN